VFLIWGGEKCTKKSQRIITEFKKLQIQRIQTKNKKEFLLEKANKQNLGVREKTNKMQQLDVYF